MFTIDIKITRHIDGPIIEYVQNVGIDAINDTINAISIEESSFAIFNLLIKHLEIIKFTATSKTLQIIET